MVLYCQLMWAISYWEARCTDCILSRMLSPCWQRMVSIIIPCSSPTRCMSSNLGFGKQFLSTFYVSLSPLEGTLLPCSTDGTKLNMIYYYYTILTFCRYRAVPTFGLSTIRHFTDNTAAMRKLAARDFEDILQVSYLSDREVLLWLLVVCNARVRRLAPRQS